jgi:hypothetical protein
MHSFAPVIYPAVPSGRFSQVRREFPTVEEATAMRVDIHFRQRWLVLALVMAPAASALAWVVTLALGAPALASKGGDDPANAISLAAMPEVIFLEEKVSDLVVHEWGTFLGMSSSDGTALDGMYHEEHALPAFVHGRSRDQLKIPQMFLKGETPVIYFYAKEKQKVTVGVGFPTGIWTQWYPQAAMVLPDLARQAERAGEKSGGRICWFAEVVPRWAMPHDVSKRSGASPAPLNMLPETSSDALWNHAREVDAAFVKTLDSTRAQPAEEFEKFLFYRGLSEAQLPLHIQENGRGTVTLDSELNLGAGVRDIFVLRVEGGRGAYTYRPALRPGETAGGVIPSMDHAQPLAEFTRKIGDDLAARLAESGLFAKEARAMVNTWQSSYFQTEGIRVLFVLPQSWTDAFIPMNINPPPRKIVRVMVGRLEMLAALRQRKAEAAVASLASRDSIESGRAYRFLHEQGRYVEPIVRHLAKTTNDEQVKSLCRRLLLTDFVTDLRAALHNANDGKPLNADPMYLRAHHARLLRQLGQDSEARSEATAALKALATYQLPPGQKIDDSPYATEIKAVVLEAMGDDRQAIEAYTRRVVLLVQSLPPNFEEAQIRWTREWWVGRAYGACVARSGQRAAIEKALREQIARQSTGGKDPYGERPPRMLLAFLLDGQGKESLALTEWQSMLARPAPTAAAILDVALSAPRPNGAPVNSQGLRAPGTQRRENSNQIQAPQRGAGQ